MNKKETIELITELAGEDLQFAIDDLRVKELDIVLKGLQYDADLAELKATNEEQAEDILELNSALAEAESTPRDTKAPVAVGKVGDDTFDMTVGQVRVHETGYPKGIYTRDQIKADPVLLALLVKRGVSFIVKRN